MYHDDLRFDDDSDGKIMAISAMHASSYDGNQHICIAGIITAIVISTVSMTTEVPHHSPTGPILTLRVSDDQALRSTLQAGPHAETPSAGPWPAGPESILYVISS